MEAIQIPDKPPEYQMHYWGWFSSKYSTHGDHLNTRHKNVRYLDVRCLKWSLYYRLKKCFWRANVAQQINARMCRIMDLNETLMWVFRLFNVKKYLFNKWPSLATAISHKFILATMECYATPWRLWRRVGIYRFLQSPPIPWILPSLYIVGIFSLFVPSTVSVHACRPKGLPPGLQWVLVLYLSGLIMMVAILNKDMFKK